MCPFCIASTAWIVAGATSTGGIAALLLKRRSTRKTALPIQTKESTDMIPHSEQPPVVSRAEWLEARKQLLIKEKEFTRHRDAVRAERQKLPWVKVEKAYTFESPNGQITLADLFEGRSQLIVYHFMLGPGWKEGCDGCSFLADHVEGARMHFENHDVKFVAISRAPLNEITRFKTRMGWSFKWVSSFGSDFNYDYNVSFTPEELAKNEVFYNFRMTEPYGEEGHGISVFYKNEAGEIFHTYSAYSRGVEEVAGALMYLDLTPKGRNETGPMSWVRLHDMYDSTAVQEESCCGSGGARA